MLKRNLEGKKKIRDRWGAGNFTSFLPNFSFLDVLSRTFGVVLNKNEESKHITQVSPKKNNNRVCGYVCVCIYMHTHRDLFNFCLCLVFVAAWAFSSCFEQGLFSSYALQA